jgi:hypothetical protein
MDACTDLQSRISTGLKLNAKNFLLRSMRELVTSYDYAYPLSYFDEDKAHTALQEIKGQVDIITAFLENLE